MKPNAVITVAALVLVGSILACNLSSGQSSSQPDFVATITAQAAALAQAGTAAPTQAAAGGAGVSAELSGTSNCRSGPGTGDSIVTSLGAGQNVTVVGQDSADNYWVVDVPGGGGTCWLWGQYAKLSGDASGLPQMSPGVAAAPKATRTPKPAPLATNTPKPAASGPAAQPVQNLAVGKNFCKQTKTSLGTYNYEANLYVSWAPPADPSLKGFRIYRNGSLIATVGAAQISYTDDIQVTGASTLSFMTMQFNYSVEAFNQFGPSPKSNAWTSCN